MKKQTFFSSWSGGKDACLAFHRAKKEGHLPKALFTMLAENNTHTHSHRLPLAIIKKQAEMLGVESITRAAAWNTYEEAFLDGLKEIKKKEMTLGVFGDIDLDGHLEWVEKTCHKGGLQSYHPLWKEKRRDLIREFVDEGFIAYLIVVKEEALPRSFLGRVFNHELIEEMERLGVDACGEGGEFHTLVTAGPIFSQPLDIKFGEQEYNDGVWFQTVSL